MTDRHVLLNRARQAKEKTPILAEAPSTNIDGTVASMRLYDRIDSWGGPFGVSAKEFADALDELSDDIEQIRLSINSPGGEVFEGIAILNLLRRHEAKVVVTVDGIAASAASFIAMAGDEVVMARNSEMMIHNSWGLVIGDSDEMREMADRLDKHNRNIASVYADRAGGEVDDWLELMAAETWFSAEEAVEAGLADRVEESTDASDAKAKIDLSVFNHAGRGKAPAPKFPAKPKRHVARDVTAAQAAARIHNAPVRGSLEGATVDFTTEQENTLRAALGIADGEPLEPDKVVALIGEKTTATQDPAKASQPPSGGGEPSPADPAPPAGADTITIDRAAWNEREERIKRLEAADARRRRDERDQVIAQAVQDGKFPPNRTEHWQRVWDADPEGTRKLLEGLAKNVVPVEELGYSMSDEDLDQEFAHLFPPVPSRKGA